MTTCNAARRMIGLFIAGAAVSIGSAAAAQPAALLARLAGMEQITSAAAAFTPVPTARSSPRQAPSWPVIGLVDRYSVRVAQSDDGVARGARMAQVPSEAGSGGTAAELALLGHSLDLAGASESSNLVEQRQSGTGTRARSTQAGSENRVVQWQGGIELSSTVVQVGRGNVADVRQSGSHLSATVVQAGTANLASVTQAGDHAFALVNQSGAANMVSIRQ